MALEVRQNWKFVVELSKDVADGLGEFRTPGAGFVCTSRA